MSEIQYDFEEPKQTKETQEDPRTSLRVTRCCGNCKFYKARAVDSHRGFCLYPNPKENQPKKRLRQSYDLKEMEKSWLRSYNTCLCELYQLRSKYYSIDLASKWIGKVFLNDGTVEEE